MTEFFLQELWHFELMAVLLCCSAFCSGSETALFSLSRLDLHRFANMRGLSARAAERLAREPAEYLGTVLFCNLLVNVLIFSVSSSLSLKLAARGGNAEAFAFGVGSLLAVIIFGEVTPKSLAVLAPAGFMRLAALPMYALHRLCLPVRRCLNWIRKVVERVASGKDIQERRGEELKLLLQSSAENGALSRHESALVGEVIDLSDLRVKEFMTPRVDLITASIDATAGDILALARRSGRIKIPLYRETRDNIIGVADARRIFLKGTREDLPAPYAKPLFVSVYQRADDTLELFKKTGARLAVALDEYGGTAGIVTAADVLAELFTQPSGGDDEENPVRKVSADEFVLSGDVSVRDWKSFLDFSDALPTVDTVGGLVACLLGRVPHPGDWVRIGGVEMMVETVRRRRAETIRLKLLDKGGENGE